MMLPLRGMLAPLGKALGNGMIYLLRDEFLIDDPAPLASPRTAEPGPGTWTVVDPGGRFSVSGDRLYNLSSGDTPYLYYAVAVAMGQVFKFVGQATGGSSAHMQLGAHTAILPGPTRSWRFGQLGSRVNICNNSGGLTLNVGIDRSYYVVVGDHGYFFLALDASGETKLAYFDRATVSEQYWIVGTRNGGAQGNFSRIVVASPVNGAYTRYIEATSMVSSAGAGATALMTANALVEGTWTAVTGQTWDLMVRRTDDNNCWIVRSSQGGGTIKLIEKQGGVETERSSAAQTWTNGAGYRVVVICDGPLILTYVNDTVKNSYGSAAFNVLEIGIKTDRAVTFFGAWPRLASGAALAALEAI